MTEKKTGLLAWARRNLGTILLVIVGAAVLFAGHLYQRFAEDSTPHYASEVDHFKYGSTGGERLAGIPYGVWKALPKMCARYMPGRSTPDQGYAPLGFTYEPGRDLPIGVSRRRTFGFDRVFLNCAVCHSGTVRETAQSEPMVFIGMPANTIDLQAFQRFMFDCVTDERFNPLDLLPEAEAAGADYDLLDRLALGVFGVPLMKDLLLLLRHRFGYQQANPPFGPGRYDTFGPAKALMNWDIASLPEAERIGTVDFPSIWNQAKREGMQLHWDGNNTSVEERNRSAAFGTGAMPVTLDRASVKRMEAWLWDKAKQPAYPFPIDRDLAARGAPIYARICAECHGASGTDFTGERVGQVVPIADIATDRHRLDSYTFDLAANQNNLYAGFPEERFRHFRKTYGYANMPLDGVWLRAPYLHNGSVPSLRDLLNPSRDRPTVFYRGNTVYDQRNVGFVADVAEQDGRRFFRYDTRRPGNGNRGHEGAIYGTELSPGEKDAIVEYMKTF